MASNSKIVPGLQISFDAYNGTGLGTVQSKYYLNAPSSASIYTPIQIDSIGPGVGQSIVGRIAYYQGRIFIFATEANDVAGQGHVNIWVSSDQGATFTKSASIGIGAGTDGDGVSTLWWDGVANVVTICYPVSNGGALQFQDYNLATRTLGSVYGVGGPVPNGNSPNYMAKRKDGSIVVFYYNTVLAKTRVFAAVFSGGASGTWAAGAQVDTFISNSLNVASQDGQGGFVFDPGSQIIHYFLLATGGVGPVYYAQFLSTNAVGTTFQFPLATGNPVLFGIPALDPVRNRIAAPNIQFSGGFDVPAVYYGTPMSSPTTWTLDTSVDPSAASNLSTAMNQGQIVVIGGTLYYIYALADPTAPGGSVNILYLVQSPIPGSTGGWTPRVQLFNTLTDGLTNAGSTQIIQNLVFTGSFGAVTLVFKGVRRIPC